MTLTALFSDDRLSHADTSVHLQHANLSAEGAPYTNALDDRPRLVWQAPDPGYWSTAATFIDIIEGGSPISVSVPATAGGPVYWGNAIEIALNMSTLSHAYTVVYNPATAKFTISANGSNTFSILWGSGAHGGASGDNPRQWLGWPKTSANTGLANSHTAPEKRYGTELFIAFDLGSAKAVDAVMCILEAGDEASINDADVSSVKAYGNATLLSSTSRDVWQAGASASMTFSPQPAEAENRLQVARAADGSVMTYRYWAFSWRFFDEDPVHGVGILKAFKKYSSTTRQIAELSGHGLVDPTPPMTISTYYPAQDLLRWVAPLNFNSWDATDYRATVQSVVRQGKAKCLVWALRWDKIVDGTYDAEDEADLGFLFFGAITSYSQGSYSGRGSTDYISGELEITQVR